MTTKRRLSATALVTLGMFGVGAISASAANHQVPMKARYSGTATATSQTTISLIGSGNATHMGRITTDGHIDITGPDNSCPGGIANINVETLTDANGDTVTVTSQDVGCPTGPGQYHGTGTWRVTGGTGKFSQATGQGSTDGHLDFNTGTFAIDQDGAIDLGG